MSAAEWVPGNAGIAELREAAKSCRGCELWVTKQRGQLIEAETGVGAQRFVATVHPSAILRTRGEEHQQAYASFVDDLRVAVAACR